MPSLWYRRCTKIPVVFLCNADISLIKTVARKDIDANCRHNMRPFTLSEFCTDRVNIMYCMATSCIEFISCIACYATFSVRTYRRIADAAHELLAMYVRHFREVIDVA